MGRASQGLEIFTGLQNQHNASFVQSKKKSSFVFNIVVGSWKNFRGNSKKDSCTFGIQFPPFYNSMLICKKEGRIVVADITGACHCTYAKYDCRQGVAQAWIAEAPPFLQHLRMTLRTRPKRIGHLSIFCLFESVNEQPMSSLRVSMPNASPQCKRTCLFFLFKIQLKGHIRRVD